MPQIDEENSKQEKVDKKDLKIIEVLRKNARIPYQQIAKKAQLSHDAVAYRIKRLEKLGVIDKYSLDISYALLDYNEYEILFQHVENKPEKTKRFYNYMLKHPNIISIIFYSDKWDIKITLLAKNILELDEILTDLDNNFSDILIDQQILEKVRNCIDDRIEDIRKLEQVELEENDKKILRILLKNSRTSLVDISKEVSLNADTIMYKLKKYEKQGLIRKYTINTNVNKMGLHWYNILLLMKVFTQEEEEKLRDYFEKNSNLVNITKTIGEWNLILTVLAKSPKEFHKIITEIKQLLGESLKDYDSLLAYKELKNKKDII